MPACAEPLPPLPARSPESGVFGDLRLDGFRMTKGGAGETFAARHWFDAHALVLCLNVDGHAVFRPGDRAGAALEPGNLLLSSIPRVRQCLERRPGERHRFLALEMRRPWMGRWVSRASNPLRDPVRRFLGGENLAGARCEIHPMTPPLTQLALEILEPPRSLGNLACWQHGKALEIVSHALFAPEETELFCERTRRVARERVARVREILLADVENPPALGELGRRVGCSPFYLSRIFRQETGATISAFLRRARLERAAELLRGGGANVTEAAMAVGYSSLSHFSKAFAEAFGCCPCLYGRRPGEAGTARKPA